MSASREMLEEFLKPLGLTANALAKVIGCRRTGSRLKDKRGITGDTAVRLGTF